MTAPYAVTVEIADNPSMAWTVTSLDDTPSLPCPIGPLTLRRSVPAGALWPAQPQPDVINFGLAANDWDEVFSAVQGSKCHIQFTAGDNPEPIDFDGDITDVKVAPARLKTPGGVVDGVIVSIIAVGYLTRLVEEAINIDETAPGTVLTSDMRLSRLLASASASPVFDSTGGVIALTDHAPLQADGDALGPHLDKLLTSLVGPTVADPGGPDHRMVIAPLLTVDRDLDTGGDPWLLVAVPNTLEVTPVADFGPTLAGGYGVVVDPQAAGVIDAGKVDRGVDFVQRKRSNVSQVTVAYKDVAANKDRSRSRSNGGDPKVRHTIETDIDDDPTQATRIADFYLPAAGADAWGVETILWRMYADTPDRLPPDLGELVTIAPVPESANPNGREWITGLVVGWTLTIAGGRPTVALDLDTARGRTVALGADQLTWADLPAGVTWAQLHPMHTWDDYDLLRGP